MFVPCNPRQSVASDIGSKSSVTIISDAGALLDVALLNLALVRSGFSYVLVGRDRIIYATKNVRKRAKTCIQLNIGKNKSHIYYFKRPWNLQSYYEKNYYNMQLPLKMY